MSTDSHSTLLHFLNVDDPSFSEGDQSINAWSFQSPVKLEDDTWNRILSSGNTNTRHTMAIPDDELHQPTFTFSHAIQQDIVIPGGLSQISMSTTSNSASSRSTTPEETTSYNPNVPSVLNPYAPALTTPTTVHSTPPPRKQSKSAASHPCAISPHSTAALFTSRASSVSSDHNQQPATKKSRAPPSGPIATKDFIPPDVTGLNKREARLVKNRAAAFLSRQRKREEFEGLEARLEVLEADNARLYRELEASRSGSPSHHHSSPLPPSNTGALTAELAGLKKQLASRDVELSNLHTRIRALVAAQEATHTEKENALREVAELKGQGQKKVEEDSSDEDEVEERSVGVGKKDLKSAGSVAAMVLMFSLSTLLSQKSGSSHNTHTTPPKQPTTSRPAHLHHSRSESLSTTLFDPYTYDKMLSSTSPFGFDEDSLFTSPQPAPISPPQVENPITSVKSTGPNSFEFDFQEKTNGKTIRVCVKSAVPFDVPSTSTFGDDLDAVEEKKGLGKRKRVMLEINPCKNSKRKFGGEETWEVDVNEEDVDEDVLMMA